MVRRPKQYAVSQPGDLVQVDTDVRPIPGVIFKQFTARDVVSRWDVFRPTLGLPPTPPPSSSTPYSTACHFPSARCRSMAAPEFAAEFEQACQQRGLHLFVLPPRSPKLNGAVERANRTRTEEFYQVTPCSLEMKALNRELRQWEKIYNTVRPHQSFGLPHPAAVPAAGSISTKGMKSVTHLLDEYIGLPSMCRYCKIQCTWPPNIPNDRAAS